MKVLIELEFQKQPVAVGVFRSGKQLEARSQQQIELANY
jgi:hypothetical protein